MSGAEEEEEEVSRKPPQKPMMDVAYMPCKNDRYGYMCAWLVETEVSSIQLHDKLPIHN